jgi:hypothetical protein
MRMMALLLAACAVAACGARDGDANATDDGRPAASAAEASADSAAGGGADAAAGQGAHAFRLHETQSGVVDSITVTQGGRVVQVLLPSENQVPPETEVERIARTDLDFDGHADLGFVTELSMAGSRSEYWRLDPASGRFSHAGVFETLQADSAAREHTTHVRGGYAGRLWTASRWRWMNGELAEVRREEQDVLADDAGFVHIIHEHRSGALAETKRDTLAEHAARSTATWMEP